MKKMKILFAMLFLFCFVASVQAQQKYEIVEDAGFLVLKGTSNSSDWQLKSNELEGDAQFVINEGELKTLSRVIINIDASTIGNDENKRMTKKAHKTLLVNDHPIVTFFAYGFSQTGNGPKKIKGSVYLGGKNVDILFDFITRGQDEIMWIMAEADAKFSDFGLEPPTDFGGLVQCNDEIKIEVQLPFVLPTDSGK